MQTKLNKDYGGSVASFVHEEPPVEVISTGILSLDYATGIGGYPKRGIVGAYGPPSIGKSTILGFNAMKSVFRADGNVVYVNLEQRFDRAWANEHGIDTSPQNENLLILRPETGEDAFEITYEAVKDPDVDLVIFDSIGSLVSASEAKEDGKARMGGRANLITFGVNRLVGPAWKNKCCVMFLNQIRDVMNAKVSGVYQQPGGHALTHAESMIMELRNIYLKPAECTARINGEDVVYRSSVNVTFTKNSWAQGGRRKASFDFYNTRVDGKPFGVDYYMDYINVGRRLGILDAGGWIAYDNEKFNGAAAFADYLRQNNDSVERLRKQVLDKMYAEQRALVDA